MIIEGLFTFHWQSVRAHLATRVFVAAADAVCLARRLERDVRERGRDEASIRRQWIETVRPMYERYIHPTRVHATVIVSGEDPVDISVETIRAEVEPRLRGRPT